MASLTASLSALASSVSASTSLGAEVQEHLQNAIKGVAESLHEYHYTGIEGFITQMNNLYGTLLRDIESLDRSEQAGVFEKLDEFTSKAENAINTAKTARGLVVRGIGIAKSASDLLGITGG